MSKSNREWVDWVERVKVLQKAAIIDEEGNILILLRSKDRPGARPGMPDLAGGSMSNDDILSELPPHEFSLSREIKEETGLKINSIEIVFVNSGKKTNKAGENVLVLALGYKCLIKGFKPDIKLSEEHPKSWWLSKEEALKIDFGDDGLHKIIERV